MLKKKRNAAGATRLANVLRMAACLVAAFPDRPRRAVPAHLPPQGHAVAVFAIARKLAILIYRMLRYGQDYVDQGAEAYEERFKERRIHSLKSMAKEIGYELKPVPVAPAA